MKIRKIVREDDHIHDNYFVAYVFQDSAFLLNFQIILCEYFKEVV